MPYTSVCVPKFQELGSPDDKAALHARVLYRAANITPVRLTCFANYAVGTIPAVDPINVDGGTKWGSGIKWGSGAKWGATSQRIAVSDWQAVGGIGFSLAPCLVVTSSRVAQPEFEIASIQLRYETGTAI